jgi:histidine ammonia-lyase/phenylalanine ammonia-lyase
MLLRANCLAKGNSGVRAIVVEQLLALLDHDLLPLIPERGSCGASGDLVPLSYVGRALTGETDVLHDGRSRDAGDALADVGLVPLELEAKEGLALVNGTSFMSALPVWPSAPRASWPMSAICRNGKPGIAGQPRPLTRSCSTRAKPHGMITSAGRIRQLLADSDLALDSELFAEGMNGSGFQCRQVQDKYSIRLCASRQRSPARRARMGQEWVGLDQLFRRQPAV